MHECKCIVDNSTLARPNTAGFDIELMVVAVEEHSKPLGFHLQLLHSTCTCPNPCQQMVEPSLLNLMVGIWPSRVRIPHLEIWAIRLLALPHFLHFGENDVLLGEE
jgi:hypothetical protein